MYVQEASWFQKQQKKKAWQKRVKGYVMCLILLLSVFSGVWFVPLNGKYFPVEGHSINIPEQVLAQETKEMTKSDTDEAVKKDEITQEEAISDNMDSQLIHNKDDGINIVAIDMGHGGMDEGCSFEGVEEKTINQNLGYRLKDKLEQLGFQVVLTTNGDEKKELLSRLEGVKEANADILISIHQNACEDNSVQGIETWYCETSGEDSRRLAKLMQQYTVLYTKAKDRGIMDADNLVIIRDSAVPSCLLETGFLSNETERTKLQTDEYCEKLVQGMADAVELYFYPKTMYLTFDDGPYTDSTNKVLDVLKEKNIKATFFLIGKNVEKNPETAKRIAEEGHTIGIHCYNHDYNVIYENAEAYMADFEKAKNIIEDITGVETKLFRFPGGSINSYNKKVYKEIIEKMTAAGYVYFDWNASLEDAVKKPNKEKMLKNAKESTLGRKVVVMLAHDTVGVTADALEELLELFPEYKFCPIDENVQPITF